MYEVLHFAINDHGRTIFRRLVLRLGFAATLCLAANGAVAADSGALEKVRLTHSTEGFAFLPLLAAKAMGYFEQAGVDAEVIKTGSGSLAMSAVVGGDADVVFGSPITVLLARQKGSDLRLISASINQVNSNIAISRDWADKNNLRPDSSVEERMAALKGITIGITGSGSGSDQLTRYLGKLEGLSPDRDMNIIGIGSESAVMEAVLQRGRVDANVTSAPTSQMAIAKSDGMMLFASSAGEIPSLDGYFYIGAAARDSWLQAHPEAARRAVKALEITHAAINDPALTTQVRDKVHQTYFSSIDKTMFDEIWRTETKAVPTDPKVTEEGMKLIVDLSQEFTGTAIPPTLIEGSFTNEFSAM